MRIVIELKKDANPQVVLNKLFSYTQLQDTVGVIMLALVNGIPKVLTLKEMLEQYIDFQVDVITRRTKFDLNKVSDRLNKSCLVYHVRYLGDNNAVSALYLLDRGL